MQTAAQPEAMRASSISASSGGATDDEACALGVVRSLGGRRWRYRSSDERVGLAIAQRLNLPEVIGRLMAARGVGLEAADAFLTPTLRDGIPDPSRLRDMDVAADRLVRAVRSGEKIAVFGDYDVDGATAAALLHRFFAAIGADLRIYIPDRMSEGYGPNAPALLRLRAEGVGIVITVDCGITAFEPLAAAADCGLEVIVVDHHVAEPRLPMACAVVNPNRIDDSSGSGQLAAVGVAFLLCVAVNRALRTAGWYGSERVEPDLRQWLDLVALGTVCDVVPLTGVNRVLVAQGLKTMARRGNPGLAALADVAGLAELPSAYHLGFALGPRINAGGRVGAADLGARLLTTDDPGAAASLARQLDMLNTERRAIEQSVLDAAVAQIRGGENAAAPLVFATGADWHPGVVGIVASRLKERFNRPACVVALADGVGRGSGRSVAGVDLGSAVIAARQAGLLLSGGGHAMAAGFTVNADRLEELQAFLTERVGGAIDRQAMPTLSIDGALAAMGVTPELAALVDRLGPFGSGNPEPRFALGDVRVVRAEIVGENHVRAILAGLDGGRVKAIAFRSVASPLGQTLLRGGAAPLHLAGHLRADNWQGRSGVQFVVDDVAEATGGS